MFKSFYLLLNITIIYNTFCSNAENNFNLEYSDKQGYTKENFNKDFKKTLEQIEKLPHILEEKRKEAEEKSKQNKNVYKHEVNYYSYLIPIAHNIKKGIEKLDIKEGEYEPSILNNMESILSYFLWNDSTTELGCHWRDINSIFEKKTASIYIEAEFSKIEFKLEMNRKALQLTSHVNQTIENIKEYIDQKESKGYQEIEDTKEYINQKESKIYQEIKNTKEYLHNEINDTKLYLKNELNDIKLYIDEKEKNIKDTVKKSIFSLSRISLCIIAGLFAYKAYNRLIDFYNNPDNIIKNTNRQKSIFHLFNKHIPQILNTLILISSVYYALRTPRLLEKIWQK